MRVLSCAADFIGVFEVDRWAVPNRDGPFRVQSFQNLSRASAQSSRPLSRPARRDAQERLDLPGFFGPVITGERRQLTVMRTPVSVRVPLGQREPAAPASARQRTWLHRSL
jgi:hypothetical protein